MKSLNFWVLGRVILKEKLMGRCDFVEAVILGIEDEVSVEREWF
jgi:hypothetical protein